MFGRCVLSLNSLWRELSLRITKWNKRGETWWNIVQECAFRQTEKIPVFTHESKEHKFRRLMFTQFNFSIAVKRPDLLTSSMRGESASDTQFVGNDVTDVAKVTGWFAADLLVFYHVGQKQPWCLAVDHDKFVNKITCSKSRDILFQHSVQTSRKNRDETLYQAVFQETDRRAIILRHGL